jgi:hypothetical protein
MLVVPAGSAGLTNNRLRYPPSRPWLVYMGPIAAWTSVDGMSAFEKRPRLTDRQP